MGEIVGDPDVEEWNFGSIMRRSWIFRRDTEAEERILQDVEIGAYRFQGDSASRATLA